MLKLYCTCIHVFKIHNIVMCGCLLGCAMLLAMVYTVTVSHYLTAVLLIQSYIAIPSLPRR